jgi:hypothetical protein
MAIIQIKVPDWLDRVCAWPMMVYRRRRYGYSYRRIDLGEGEWTIVEAGDYYRLSKFKWYVNGTGKKLYAVRSVKTGPLRTRMTSLHREIMNPPDGLVVDHRNRNSLDNRRANLRLATYAENNVNKQKRRNSVSRYIGVCLEKRTGRWEARIWQQGKGIRLGRFNNEIEAAKAYDEAAKRYRGEFACLNFPESADSPASPSATPRRACSV